MSSFGSRGTSLVDQPARYEVAPHRVGTPLWRSDRRCRRRRAPTAFRPRRSPRRDVGGRRRSRPRERRRRVPRTHRRSGAPSRPLGVGDAVVESSTLHRAWGRQQPRVEHARHDDGDPLPGGGLQHGEPGEVVEQGVPAGEHQDVERAVVDELYEPGRRVGADADRRHLTGGPERGQRPKTLTLLRRPKPDRDRARTRSRRGRRRVAPGSRAGCVRRRRRRSPSAVRGRPGRRSRRRRQAVGFERGTSRRPTFVDNTNSPRGSSLSARPSRRSESPRP